MAAAFMDAKYWRGRAEEARLQADEMHDPTLKQKLLQIAEAYDRLAAQADVRGRSGRPGSAQG